MIKNRRITNCIKILFLVLLVILMSLFILKGINNETNGSNKTHSLKEASLSTNSKLSLDIEEGNYKVNDEDAIPVFKYTSLSDEIMEKITGVSWKENAPVKFDELSYINVTYWGFDDTEYVGKMIVHKKLAKEITEIFKELYEEKFPIDKIRLIDEYDANDQLSMADNNTSAFCSREVTGKKGVFSNHSYGIAIDINPIQNPYVKGDIVMPEEGNNYLDRSNVRKGMIIKGDVCYNAFKSRGWIWGGEWSGLKDYQHFEKEIEMLLQN